MGLLCGNESEGWPKTFMPSVQTIKMVEPEAELRFSPNAIRAAIRRREDEIKVLRNALQIAEQVGPLLETRESIRRRNPAEAHVKDTAVRPSNGAADAPNLRVTVLELASVMRKFTAGNLLDALMKKNFQFQSPDPKGAVSDAIYGLKKSGKIKIAEEGNGGKPHTYELHK